MFEESGISKWCFVWTTRKVEYYIYIWMKDTWEFWGRTPEVYGFGKLFVIVKLPPVVELPPVTEVDTDED